MVESSKLNQRKLKFQLVFSLRNGDSMLVYFSEFSREAEYMVFGQNLLNFRIFCG